MDEDLLPRRQEVSDHHVARPAAGRASISAAYGQADLLAVGEDHAAYACAGGSRPVRARRCGRRAGRASRPIRPALASRLRRSRAGRRRTRRPSRRSRHAGAARRRSPRRGPAAIVPETVNTRGRRHVGLRRGDLDEQARRAGGRWSPRRSRRRTTRRASSPSRRRRSGSVGQLAQRVGERVGVADGHEQSGAARGARSRGSHRRRSTRAAGRRRPASESTIGRQSPSVGRQKTSARWYKRISSGSFGPSPWWTRTPSAAGTGVAGDDVQRRRRRPSARTSPQRVEQHEAALAHEVAADEQDADRRRWPASIVAADRRPPLVVDARRDHHDLVGRDVVAVDEAVLGPLRPRDDRRGPPRSRRGSPAT